LSQAKAIKRGLKDPVFFPTYWLGIELNPFQKRCLEKVRKALWDGDYAVSDLIEMIWKAGNRSGKTVLLSIVHIYFAYYKIGITYGPGYETFKYRTFDISPQSRQAKECLKYIEEILTGRLSWVIEGRRYSNGSSLKLKDFFEGKNENLGELRYTNRSITYAFSTGEDQGTGFQGLPAGFISYDECPLSHHLETELDSNVYSRLGDYGKLVLLVATPNEQAKSQQYFYHLCNQSLKGKNNFLIETGSYLENIFIPMAKRESHEKTVMSRDPIMARQILFGEFVSTSGSMFEGIAIERLWRLEHELEPEANREYLISVDWGVSDKGDETVMLVWDVTEVPVRIVKAYAKRGGDPYELIAVLKNLTMAYNEAEVILDGDGMGGTVFKKLLRDLKPHVFNAGQDEKANALFYTQVFMTKNRKKRIENGEIIEDNPEFGWIHSSYYPDLADQLATYQLDDKKLKQDWVSAFYMGCWQIWKRFGDKPKNRGSFKLNLFKVYKTA